MACWATTAGSTSAVTTRSSGPPRAGAPRCCAAPAGLAPQPIPLVDRARTGRSWPSAPSSRARSPSPSGADVVASHHIGDLEHLATYRSFLQAIDHLLRPLRRDARRSSPTTCTPSTSPRSWPPTSTSRRSASSTTTPTSPRASPSTVAPHPVLGLAFDGLGYGTDGTLWGGELLVADLRGFERVGHLAAISMPGGGAAIREPWRMGVAWAPSRRSGRSVHRPARRRGPLDLVAPAMDRSRRASVGLFDAVAALLGMRPVVSYEAQAAIELEALARTVPPAEAPTYPVEVARRRFGDAAHRPRPLVAALVDGQRRRRGAGAAGRRLPRVHRSGGGRGCHRAGPRARPRHGGAQRWRVPEPPPERRSSRKRSWPPDLEVLVHRIVPPNDGGISIGQAAVAAALTA